MLVSTEVGADYTKLQELLMAGKLREADEETKNVMYWVSQHQKKVNVNACNADLFPTTDLRAIDRLWSQYSKGRFGFSVQKQIWLSVGCQPGVCDFSAYERFGDEIGWRFNGQWKSYNDLQFELSAPLGHLPAYFFLAGTIPSCGGLSLLKRSDL